MASPAQASANLANAQNSTGPRTEAGKQRSARNAVTHGLTSALVVLPTENQEEFDAYREQIHQNLAPGNTFEAALTDEVVSALWRLRRIDRLEGEAMLTDEPDLKRLNFFSLHSGRLRRGLAITMKLLLQAKEMREKTEKAELADAVLIRKSDLISNRSTNLQQFGFDLSLDHVDRVIRREQAVQTAARLVNPLPNRRAA